MRADSGNHSGNGGNRATAGIPPSVHRRFEAQVSARPDGLAVQVGGDSLTYSGLNAAANRLARRILDRCGEDVRPVVVFMDKGLDLMAAMMAAFKAAKIYVPLDPSYPEARCDYILRNTAPCLVVTTSAGSDLSAWARQGGWPLLSLDELGEAAPRENVSLPVEPQALACILYTSGSTGEPKGIMHSHRSLTHAAELYIGSMEVTPEDRILCPSSHAFLGFLRPTLGALLSGASFFPARFADMPQLGDLLVRERITVFHAPCSVFRHLLDVLAAHGPVPTLRRFYGGGEPLYRADVERWRRLVPEGSTYLYVLGITEADVVSCLQIGTDTPIDTDLVPLGYAVEGVQVLILDEDGHVVAPGGVGEIAVRSVYLSPGYWRRPEMTAERFRPDPSGGESRTYLTGDLGRMRPDGCLEYVGRKDFQVKVRGFLVQLGEVDQALRACDRVGEAVVLARGQEDGGNRLVAYVAGAEQAGLTVGKIREQLAHRLPDYMIPSAFVFMDKLPLTPNGKVDRAALPDGDGARPEMDATAAEPRSGLEVHVASLWEEALSVSPIGVRDNFFELGGDSMKAALMLSRIEATLGVRLPVETFYAEPTVQGLARAVNRDGQSADIPLLVPLQPLGSRPPFFFVSPGVGWYLSHLADHLGHDQPVYVLNALSIVSDGQEALDVVDLAERYVQEIRAVQPNGPYLLGGVSAGGIVAFEMGRQLVAVGQALATVVLVDVFSRPTRLPLVWAWRRRIRRGVRLTRRVWRMSLAERWQAIIRALRRSPRSEQPARRVHKAELLGHSSGIIDAHARAARRYKLQPYAVRADLFWSEGTYIPTRRDPRLGWEKLALGGVTIHRVPGFHHRVLWPPHVSVFAQKLEACLSDAYQAAAAAQ